MVVVSRQDLTPGQQAVQSTHAALDFGLEFSEVASEWHKVSNYLIQLAVKDEQELKALIRKIEAEELRYVAFREPDLNNVITAVAIEPCDASQRLVSNIPLMLKERPKADIVFHFNKAYNADPSIPAWVVKHKGETHYVNHIDVSDGVAWSTKETPDNPHTKGAIKFKGNLEIAHENNLVIAKIK